MSSLARPTYIRAPASATSIVTDIADIADLAEPEFSPVSQPARVHDRQPAPGDTKENPFATPYESRVPSRAHSITELALPKSYFRSRRVKKGEVPQPWRDQKESREIWVTLIPLIGILVGLALSALLVWDGMQTVVNHEYCPVLDETFRTNELDKKTWLMEAEVGGFGNGQFEETTSTGDNVFVRDGMLHIKPAVRKDPEHIASNYVLNLLKDGVCTSKVWSNCVVSTNTTNGTIIPPIQSGRISTLPNIRYGRIEVTARLPRGDWLWPAIWLLPRNSSYGAWPASGEIDMVESRGNNYTHPQGGNDIISSALHWGPDAANDAWWRTNNKRNALQTTFASKFHTFGLEWSEKYLFTYIDSRLLQVMYVNFPAGANLWDRGNFPSYDAVNGTELKDPWYTGGDVVPSRPFDQDFYLILNVAVGGTNGWFEDGKMGKPWVDSSKSARKDFWERREQWLPTWGEDGEDAEMLVKSVRMWQQKGYNGC